MVMGCAVPIIRGQAVAGKHLLLGNRGSVKPVGSHRRVRRSMKCCRAALPGDHPAPVGGVLMEFLETFGFNPI